MKPAGSAVIARTSGRIRPPLSGAFPVTHRIRPRRHGSSLLAAALALAAAACTDRANPVGPGGPGPGGPGTPGVPITVQALQCTGNRAALTVNCVPASPDGGPAKDILVGGQGVYVQVTTSGVNYNSGTGQFTFNTTLQNLIEQPMGTTDGTTLDPNGIRIFFHSGPTVTGGSGVASVVPDGFATFTAAGQPFYQYNQVLANGVTSGAKGWTLVMPPTVTTFTFLLYVSAPVEYPNGYITLDGQLPGYSFGDLHPDDTHNLVPVVKSNVGNVIATGSLSWGTTNADCATVDGAGVVTGVQFATCDITVTDGTRSGSMSFDVTGTTRNWTGATSTAWDVPGNWGGGRVPVTADSVNIPFGVPNYPVLNLPAVTVRGVSVADNATLSLGANTLTANANVATGPTVGSGILATTGGLLVLGGTTGSTVRGRIPAFRVTGSYSLSGDTWAVATAQVDLALLASENYNLQVTSQ